MASYKLTKAAQADLVRIHQHGVRVYGESRADAYITAFFEHFEQLAERPLIYPAVDHIRKGYRRSLCGVDHVYYRIQEEHVHIVAIIGQQDLKSWL